MLRQLHSIPGLIASLIVILLAITGAVMSIEPTLDRMEAGAENNISVAELAAMVAKNNQGVELITRSANGTIRVQYFNDSGAHNNIVDPQTGQSLNPTSPSPIFGFFKQLHRTLYIGTTGRVIAGITAFIMLLACFSGLFMLAKRLGGWRQLFTTSKGKQIPRLHVDISRWVIIGLFITAFTGTYMSLAKFEFIDDGKGGFLAFPEEVLGTTPAPIAELAALKATPLSVLRELRFPFEDDFFDVFTITTSEGQGYIDQASGKMLVYEANGLSRNVFEFFYMLHTGQGLWWLGILLGLSALGLPIMAVTGTIIWWRRWSSSTKIKNNIAANKAETIILVGSESNTTWGFAQHLQQKLTALGGKTHVAEMNKFTPKTYANAKYIIFFAATYGDGTAPETANKFLQKLAAYNEVPPYQYTVLGFGDKQFTQFAKFAIDVEAALKAKGWRQFSPLELIDKQSCQSFETWGVALGQKLSLKLQLNHVVSQPKIYKLKLRNARDHSFDDKFNTRILQFSLPDNMPKFEAGDLVGIKVPNSDVPRYYSLATSSKDGQLGICVAKKHGGLCSPYLHELAVGDEVEAFIQINPHFRPNNGKSPLIMIGAGTGIAPFMGFIANTKKSRDAYLYWGGRHPDADFLYKQELDEHLSAGRLTALNTAFSRAENGKYVQAELLQNTTKIKDLMSQGGQFIVCGGRDMASEVKNALTEMGFDITTLKAQKRYIEDVY